MNILFISDSINMQMESRISLDCDGCFHPESQSSKDSGVNRSPQDNTASKIPVKKQPRQWAAWTHQEEESFFTALRQVGKNFEKITCRVQSKNKDQVRHYYYRLVRRMNKLLGPDLCLDAKNSKDTNAAMLRWWSLLEKYSCKASKLHLKPRRFKIFVETLEHQLLKDRKKNIRKRPSQLGHSSAAAPTTVLNQSRASGHDNSGVELVLLDGQNIQKFGAGKGSSLRRNVNIDFNRSNLKGDSCLMKPMRQRRKSGAISTAAYRRWERAAIAGVSLVADAAEHLERTATGEVIEHFQGLQRQKDFEFVGKDVSSLTNLPHNLFIENNIQASQKLKLQLFPIDEGTRRALEMISEIASWSTSEVGYIWASSDLALENHNPHLELTLSSRKKISSVLEHLNRKWGNSSIASGEITLFPYCVQRENILGSQNWTQDSPLSAADVYALIGSPTVFRLRYGWLSAEPGSATFHLSLESHTAISHHNAINIDDQYMNTTAVLTTASDHEGERFMDHKKDQGVMTKDMPSLEPSCKDLNLNFWVSEHTLDRAGKQREADSDAIARKIEDDPKPSNGVVLSAVEWADSLTNISVGDLLCDASHNIDVNSVDPPSPGGAPCLQQIPFSCDSFDAAIAAHICKHQSKANFQQDLGSHSSSIWDAEETCDAFSFPKNRVAINERLHNASGSTSPEPHKEIAEASLAAPIIHVEDVLEAEEPMDDDSASEDLMDEFLPDPSMVDNSAKDLNGLTDIYWPDSLGPLDLEIPSCRYHNEELILSDSLSGLNRLIASSLDAFQNCSFFGLDKKEMASNIEARETTPFSDYKIGGEV